MMQTPETLNWVGYLTSTKQNTNRFGVCQERKEPHIENNGGEQKENTQNKHPNFIPHPNFTLHTTCNVHAL